MIWGLGSMLQRLATAAKTFPSTQHPMSSVMEPHRILNQNGNQMCSSAWDTFCAVLHQGADADWHVQSVTCTGAYNQT